MVSDASRCSSCRAAILWIETPKGGRMPVDPGRVRVWPVTGGDMVVVTDDGRVRSATDREPAPDLFGDVPAPIEGRRPHWSTCPHAHLHRKPRTGA